MTLPRLLASLLFALAAGLAHGAGLRTIEVPADAQG
ncbi:MAG: dienelactone hydrolase, partial [Burkholderiaceae bacterium]